MFVYLNNKVLNIDKLEIRNAHMITIVLYLWMVKCFKKTKLYNEYIYNVLIELKIYVILQGHNDILGHKPYA